MDEYGLTRGEAPITRQRLGLAWFDLAWFDLAWFGAGLAVAGIVAITSGW
ncbi:hypothetical protein ACQR16_20100 [Bradyrhizobium oligotrophicum]